TWACAPARRIGRPTTGCVPGLSGDSSPCPSTLVPFPFSWSLSMAFPAFFAQAPRIALHDPLAQLLGASDDGLIEYGYEDAVRLAGHSCPTVAGAWLMTVRALRALYPDAPPQRGDIEATFADSATSGVTGVIANVVSLVTGATTDTGFKGLAGQHDRRNPLHFQGHIPGKIA